MQIGHDLKLKKIISYVQAIKIYKNKNGTAFDILIKQFKERDNRIIASLIDGIASDGTANHNDEYELAMKNLKYILSLKNYDVDVSLNNIITVAKELGIYE